MDRKIDHLLFEGPVQVPLVVWHVLEMPDKLASIRMKGERGVLVKAVVGHARLVDEMQHGAGVVRLARPEIGGVHFLVMTSGAPALSPAAFSPRLPIPPVPPKFAGPGVRVEFPGGLARRGVQR